MNRVSPSRWTALPGGQPCQVDSPSGWTALPGGQPSWGDDPPRWTTLLGVRPSQVDNPPWLRVLGPLRSLVLGCLSHLSEPAFPLLLSMAPAPGLAFASGPCTLQAAEMGPGRQRGGLD